MKLQNYFKEIIDGELHTLQAPPVNFITEDGRTIINFNLSPSDMIAHGWHEWTDEELEAWHKQYDPEPILPDQTGFITACHQFQLVCQQIGEFIGDDGFKGGFDEYQAFILSEATQQNPSRAALLASMWAGANEYAKYEGNKLGYGQPEWWYKCWEMNPNEA